MSIFVLLLFSAIIFPIEKAIVLDLGSLTLEDQLLLLRFYARDGNKDQFRYAIFRENAENKKARHDALQVFNPDIIDKDAVCDNMKMYQK